MPDCSSNVFFNVTGDYNNAFAATSSGSQVTTPIFLSDGQSVILSNLTTNISANTSKITALDTSLSLLKSQVLALNNLDFASIDVSFVTHNELDASFQNVIKRSNLDASFVNLINRSNLDASFANVYTKSSIDNSFVLKTIFDASFANVINQDELNASLSNYALDASLDDYALTSSLSGYALDASLSNYALTSNLQNNTFNASLNTLDVSGSFTAKNLILSGDLTVNGTKNIINSNQVDISDLAITVASNLIDKTHLISNESGLDVSNIASVKYNGTKWTVLGGELYVGNNKVALDASLASYALDASLASYALTSSLADYALDASLDSYALTSSLADYALDASLSVYALDASLADYALTSSLSFGVCIITETKSANVASDVSFTNSGSNTAQTKPRRFNAKTTNGGLDISLNSDTTFYIASAGTYLFEGNALLSVPESDGQTVFAKLFLNNQTDSLGSVIVGDSFRYGPVSSSQFLNTNFPCFINGIYTITAGKVFSLDHSVISQYYHPTGGTPSNILSATEIYAT